MLEAECAGFEAQVYEFLFKQVFELVARVDEIEFYGLAEVAVGRDEADPGLAGLHVEAIPRGRG